MDIWNDALPAALGVLLFLGAAVFREEVLVFFVWKQRRLN